jgi:hypothetical protein
MFANRWYNFYCKEQTIATKISLSELIDVIVAHSRTDPFRVDIRAQLNQRQHSRLALIIRCFKQRRPSLVVLHLLGLSFDVSVGAGSIESLPSKRCSIYCILISSRSKAS